MIPPPTKNLTIGISHFTSLNITSDIAHYLHAQFFVNPQRATLLAT